MSKVQNLMVPGVDDLENIEKMYEEVFSNASRIEGYQDIHKGEVIITLNNGDVIHSIYKYDGHGNGQKHIITINNQEPVTFIDGSILDYYAIEEIWKKFDYKYPAIVKHYYNELRK